MGKEAIVMNYYSSVTTFTGRKAAELRNTCSATTETGCYSVRGSYRARSKHRGQ